MTALPPSVLAVLESDRNGGSFTPIRSAAARRVGARDGLGGHRLARADDRRRRRDNPDDDLFPLTFAAPDLGAGGVALLLAWLRRRPCSPRARRSGRSRRQADFLKGDVEDLSIDSDGRVFLGPVGVAASPRPPRRSSGRSWPRPDGTLWAGHRQRRQGAEGRARRQDVDLLRRRRAGGARARAGARTAASTSPRRPTARSTRSPPTARRRRFFDPDDKYIWALAVDAAGNVFAATGDKGVIYKITPDGKGALFYKTNTTNVVSLALTPTGDLIAGTESPGRVFRIDATGKAFVLLDSPFKEIHALRVDGRRHDLRRRRSAARRARATDRPPDADDHRDVAPGGAVRLDRDHQHVDRRGSCDRRHPAAARGRPRHARRPDRGAIYRIRPDGFWDRSGRPATMRRTTC